MSDLLLFIDTETTGMFRRELPWNDPSQPRMVQVAAILSDSAGQPMAEFSTTIKPCGQWTVTDGAAAVHGFTTEHCEKYGLAIRPVLDVLDGMFSLASHIVAHNSGFDSQIIRGEFSRIIGESANPTKPWHCTMLESTPILKIPSPRRLGDYKWPTLSEAYRHFTKSELQNAHDALADVRACKDIYFAIRKAAV